MYKQHSLRFEFTNQTTSFDKSGNNKISISNVKSMFKFGAYGNQAGVQAEATIYGLGLDLLSALSSKGINTWMQMERIHTSVYADDTKVFSGFIVYSCANMNAAPETALTLNMVSGFDLQAASAQPFSRPGTVKLADVLAAICEPYQYRLNPVGIDGLVASNIYLSGSPLEQIRYACNQAGANMQIDGSQVTVWPMNAAKDDVVPLVSPEYGLIGYPVFTASGITFQTQYSGLLAAGRYVNLDTSLPYASGKYYLYVVENFLSSWIENGPWHSICQGGKQLVTP